MAAHLARHGMAVTIAETASYGLAIADVLLDYAADRRFRFPTESRAPPDEATDTTAAAMTTRWVKQIRALCASISTVA